MKLIRLLLGRRQFLFVLLSSAITLAFGRAARAFNLIFRTGTAKASEKQTANGERKQPKGIVVYYSATGNTAQVAEAIWRGMKSVIPCNVAPIKKVKPEDMADYDVVAIGAPNWYFRVPANVLVFIQGMPRMDGKHCVMFGTHGSGSDGMFWIMSRNILKKGMTIIGWSGWYGTDFLTPHSCVPDGEWGHPDSIDLVEAEAFGRQMALNSIRIHEGENNLLSDEIPTSGGGSGNPFMPSISGTGQIGFAGGVANGKPKFDFTKCVYPRCDQCIENCPVHAIDFSVIAPAGFISDRNTTVDPVVLKEACQQCGGLCERVCHYDAIAYVGDSGARIFQKIDMMKCTYPKCTICMDNCPQDAIDVSKNPPIIHNRCENESLCYGVCPENAIEFTLTSMHIGEGAGSGGGTDRGMGPMPMNGEPGAGEHGHMASYSARYRRLVQEECLLGTVNDLKAYPRVPIHQQLWPYNMDEV
ncbi:MAG: flavodoxin domain-containing protein [Deltaproteobacteria bacterium]|nr:flavodoxin domain-containing protein [Deltaproteobacteria bacterium]